MFGTIFGLSLENLSLNIGSIGKGVLYGVLFSLPLVIMIFVVTTNNTLGVHFSKTPRKNFNKKSFFYELLFRIPFGTALSEEIIFRGVLLGLLLQNHSLIVSIITSSVLFGLWHIFPTLQTNKSHDPLIEYMDNQRKRNIFAVLIAVIATTMMGIFLNFINIQSKSLISSWIIHSSINGFTILGGYIAVWYEYRHKKPKN